MANKILFKFFSGVPGAAKEIKTVEADEGSSILEVAHSNGVDLEGACEGSLACSTCHVILNQSDYDSLPKISEEEEDMLDLAYNTTQTSRLGCQVMPHVKELKNGEIEIYIPQYNRNL